MPSGGHQKWIEKHGFLQHAARGWDKFKFKGRGPYMRGTQKALMARGLDSGSAAKLARDGWTLGKLKLAGEAELLSLGLRSEFIDGLFEEARPPIPNDVLMSVLFANRYQCCVCRNPELSVIVHHIEEWAASRLHEIRNLAVLCLHHHDEAHSKKTLSRNLDTATLRAAKEKWEAEVRRLDTEAILKAVRLDHVNWNYINGLRVFELANALGVKFDSIRRFGDMAAAGLVQSDGLPTPVHDDSLFYMYEGPNVISRVFYASEVIDQVIRRISIINISDYLDKGVLGVALAPGDFIFVQGAHTFSPITDKKDGRGRGQICEGIRRANQVEVRFTFDRWEALSSSAKNVWLVGTRNQGCLVHVKDLSREDGRLVIRGTVLGICSNFGELKTRDYAHRWLEWMPSHSEEEEIDEDEFDES